MALVRNFRKEYRDLESSVQCEFRRMIHENGNMSEWLNSKSIKVDFRNYLELAEVGGRLCFIGEQGYHFDFLSHNLEDLIDLLESLREGRDR